MFKPELLAPAGNMEKLKTAIAFDADAVYLGLKDYSLRSYAGNFSLDEADGAVSYAHKLGKKVYVTLNIYPYTEEFEGLLNSALLLQEMGVDALIVSDLGVIYELKKAGIKLPLHISTQANTMNLQTVKAYAGLGASRVNLARELSLEKIREIQSALSTEEIQIQTEVFIHGAVCFSYSGRCAISDYMTGRKANRGECTHPCRWKYSVVEETRDGEYYPVFEDGRGLYLFNNKDLALFPFVNDLIKAGVNSFKIEGRMKTVHYIATVVSLYRQIINGKKLSTEEAFKYLGRVNNRGYSYGFMKGGVKTEDYNYNNDVSGASAEFVAVFDKITVHGGDTKTVLAVRNRIFAGETLEVLSPNSKLYNITLDNPLTKEDGEKSDILHNGSKFLYNGELPEYSILRRVV